MKNEISLLMRSYDSSKAKLDPSTFRFVSEYIYLENLALKLIEMDHHGHYSNQLADTVKISSDKQDYTFTLREAYFADGTKILARDVVNTFKRLILNGTPHSAPKTFIRGAGKLTSLDGSIEGLGVIDDKTVFLGLNNPMKEIFYYLQLVDYSILHPAQYSKRQLYIDDWSKVNSGPYLLKKENGKYTFQINEKSLLSEEGNPEKVVPYSLNNQELISMIDKKELHLGKLSLQEVSSLKSAGINYDHINLFTQGTDGIIYLALNLKSDMFKSEYTRQWFQKKILSSLGTGDKVPEFTQKAIQYFLPGARGYVSDKVVQGLLKDIDLSHTPDVLKNGIKVRTFTTMEKYLPKNLEIQLQQALGVPVKISYDVNPPQLTGFLKNRDFDVFLSLSSMSYKVLSEALNIAYFSLSPTLIDPTGQIKTMIEKYQQTDDASTEQEYIENIIKRMILDSECIPLLYTMSPVFYDKEKLGISKASIDESIKLWKAYVK